MGQMSLHPPFRAVHIGSLVRPPELLRARARHAAGELDREELAAIEDEAMRGAIELQEGVGLEVITDGNLSRRAADHRSGAADTQSLEPQISDLRDEADAVRGWRQETILRLFRRRYSDPGARPWPRLRRRSRFPAPAIFITARASVT
jgi:hypothetical protein